MKNLFSFVKIELFLWALIILSFLSLLLQIPYADKAFTLISLVLVLAYIFFMLLIFVQWKKGKGITLIKSISYFYFSSVVLALQYKTMSWPSPSPEFMLQNSFNMMYFLGALVVIYLIIKRKQLRNSFTALRSQLLKIIALFLLTIILKAAPDDFFYQRISKTYGKPIYQTLKDEKGRLRAEGNLLGNKRQGEWIEYNEAGIITNRIFYKDGLADGKGIAYHENGKVAIEGVYAAGKENGFFINYYDSGIKKAEGKIINKELKGQWIYFSEEGDTLEVMDYPE